MQRRSLAKNVKIPTAIKLLVLPYHDQEEYDAEYKNPSLRKCIR